MNDLTISITSMNTPQINHAIVVNSNDNSKTVTGAAFANSACFALKAAELTVSPRYSLFCFGCAAILVDAGSGGALYGIGTTVGVLSIMASPIYGVFRFGIGIPTIVGGVLATTATGVVHGLEVTAKKVALLFKPSLAIEQRIQFTTDFVNRMLKIVTTVNPTNDNKKIILDHPECLVNIAAISVAFLSRDVEGSKIKAVDNIVARNELKVDEVRKEYFDDVCDMKILIQSLNLSPDVDHAWAILTTALTSLADGAPTNGSLEDLHRFEICQKLADKAMNLSGKVTKDEVFQSIWNEKRKDI